MCVEVESPLLARTNAWSQCSLGLLQGPNMNFHFDNEFYSVLPVERTPICHLYGGPCHWHVIVIEVSG